MTCLPLRMGRTPMGTGRRAGKLTKAERWDKVRDLFTGTAMDGGKERAEVAKVGITIHNLAPVYFSLDPYNEAFQERIDIRRYGAYEKKAGGMRFDTKDNRLVLRDVVPSLSVAKIPAWRS